MLANSNARIPEADPWAALTYPLSLTELKRLSWLRNKVDAMIWLADHEQRDRIDLAFARRLAFYRWLYQTGGLES